MAPLTETIAPDVTVDWTRGVMLVRGIGPADRHAPEPAVARVAAERRAVDAARARLADAVATIPRAGLELTDPVRAALARETARAPVVARDYGTDGSTIVEVGLGLEAIRQAAAGPRAIAAGSDDGAPAVVVIDARGLGVRPAIGLGVRSGAAAAGSAPWTGAVTFATAPAAGQGAARAATAIAAGVITIDGATPPPAAHVIILVKP